MGFVAEELNETERRSIQKNKVANMAVVYGKEASMWKASLLHVQLSLKFCCYLVLFYSVILVRGL